MQLYPWSPDLFWPGHLHGTGCLSARSMDTGFPTVVSCLRVSLGFAVTPPILAGVQAVCVSAQVSASPRPSLLRFVVRVFWVGFRGNSATPGWGLGCVFWNMGFGCAPPFVAWVFDACVWVWVFRAPCFFWLVCLGLCSLARVPSVRGWRFPPSVFFSRGEFVCSSLWLPWAGARTGRHSVWLTGWLLVLWVAAGHALPPWVGWVMYTLELVACPVGLGASAGSAGWAVAPASFVRSWIRGGGGGCPVSPRSCGAGLVVASLTFWWRFVQAGRCCRGGSGGYTDRRVVAPSPCVAGWCGVVPRLWARFLPFWNVRRLALVRPTVSVPRFGAVVCFGAPCCVALFFLVLHRPVLCCAVMRSALSCRALPCRAIVRLAEAWRAALCCAAPRCVLVCCVVSLGALSRCAARQCAVLRCAVLPRVVPCFTVLVCVGADRNSVQAWDGVGAG